MKPHVKPIAQTIAHYAASRVYQQLLGVVTSFLSPKLLSPSQFGIWTLMKIIPRYGYYSHLGAGSSMRYLVPYYQEKDDAARARLIEQTTFFTGVGFNLAMCFVFLAVFTSGHIGKEMRVGFLCMGIFLVLQFMHEYYLTYLKAHARFDLVTATNYVFLTAGFIITVPLLVWLHLYGLYISTVLAEVVALIYLRIRLGRTMKFGWSGDVLRELLSKGMPIMLLNFSVALLATIDRVTVSWYLGTEELGHYGVAILAAGALMNVPGAAREVIETNVMRSADLMASEKLIEEYAINPLLQTAARIPFLIGAASLMLPPAIIYLLPQHVACIIPSQIMLCGVFFLALIYVTPIVIVAKNWELQSLLLMPAGLAANIGLGILSIHMGYGLPGVATVSSLSYFVVFSLLMIFLASKFKDAGKIFLRRLPSIFVPFIVMCALIAGISWVTTRTLPYHWLRGLLGTALFMGAYTLWHEMARHPLALPVAVPWRALMRRLPYLGRSVREG